VTWRVCRLGRLGGRQESVQIDANYVLPPFGSAAICRLLVRNLLRCVVWPVYQVLFAIPLPALQPFENHDLAFILQANTKKVQEHD
jgi:hypothetical protein